MACLLRINYFIFVYQFLVLLYLLLFRIGCAAVVLLVCFVFCLLEFFGFWRWVVLVLWYLLWGLVCSV